MGKSLLENTHFRMGNERLRDVRLRPEQRPQGCNAVRHPQGPLAPCAPQAGAAGGQQQPQHRPRGSPSNATGVPNGDDTVPNGAGGQ